MTIPTLWICLWQAVLLAVFGLGPALFVVRRAGLPPSLVTPLAVALAAAQSYLLFFVFFESPTSGARVAQLLLVVHLGLLWRQRRYVLVLSGETWVPALLVLTTAVGYLLIVDAMPVTPNSRYFSDLPIDNLLPRYFADNIEDGVYQASGPLPPISGDYRTSDRPPLQTALVLMNRAVSFGFPSQQYQALGTLCQATWVAVAWELLALLGLLRWRQIFGTGLLIGSGFFLLNTTYVWPKLLAAWPFLTALMIVLDRRSSNGLPALRGATVGGLLALSLLAHGGVAFSLVTLPLLLWMAPLRPRLEWRLLTVAGATMVGLLTPWSLYQRWIDPPGNRLVKMHLAGVNEVDERSVGRAIIDAYTATPVRQLIAVRMTNLAEQFLVLGKSAMPDPLRWIQWQQFFHHVAALDVLIVGLVAGAVSIVRAKSSTDARPELFGVLMLYAVVTLAVWIGLMFQPNQALIHQGSYANTALLFVLGAAGLTWLPRAWRWGLAAVHLSIFVAWVVPWPTAVGPATSYPHIVAGLCSIGLGLWVANRQVLQPS